MSFVPSHSAEPVHERRAWIVVHPKGLVARRGDAGAPVVLLDDADADALGARAQGAPIERLGALDDADVLAAPIDGRVEPPYELVGLRALAALVDPERFAIVGRAMHTCDWLTTSRFCGRCGSATARAPAERCMACPRCGLHLYPRIAPAIITLVRKGDLALLASNAKFPGVFYSTLAGFADLGETLEETLAREVKEEVGVDVTNVRYFGSQPWPFPHSLMIAFTAEWASGDIVVDPSELSDAKWFAADALPPIPPPISIARRLIDAWVAEVTGRPAR